MLRRPRDIRVVPPILQYGCEMECWLEQPEIAQLPPQRFRHDLGSRRSAVEVAWDVFGFEIAPALKRPPRPRVHQHEFRLKHQLTTSDTGFVDVRAHVDKRLPAHHSPSDHPIKRAAISKFIGALGHHARSVHMLALKAALPAFALFLADPILEILDRVATDTELDKMKSHNGDVLR